MLRRTNRQCQIRFGVKLRRDDGYIVRLRFLQHERFLEGAVHPDLDILGGHQHDRHCLVVDRLDRAVGFGREDRKQSVQTAVPRTIHPSKGESWAKPVLARELGVATIGNVSLPYSVRLLMLMAVNWHRTWKAWLSLMTGTILVMGAMWMQLTAPINAGPEWVCHQGHNPDCVKKVPISN